MAPAGYTCLYANNITARVRTRADILKVLEKINLHAQTQTRTDRNKVTFPTFLRLNANLRVSCVKISNLTQSLKEE